MTEPIANVVFLRRAGKKKSCGPASEMATFNRTEIGKCSPLITR